MLSVISDLSGKSIRYSDTGHGSVVVLLHGFMESLEIWDDFVGLISVNHRVITIDLPGHGQSDVISGVHSMELMAQCVRQVLDACAVTRCAVIGHSMGGYVSLAFAEQYPEMITGLGLFHSSALADDEEAKMRRDTVIEFVMNDHTSFISNFIPDLFAPLNRPVYREEINELISGAKKMNCEAIVAALAGMRDRSDRCHVLRLSQYPVLFIIGKLDSRMDFRKAMELAAMPDDSVILLMGDVGHMGYIEAREKTIYAVSAFLEGL